MNGEINVGLGADRSWAVDQEMPPALYVVATPIGNLADISLRALAVLQEVDVVYAEDTRVTRKLLDRYGLVKELHSFRQSPDPQLNERTATHIVSQLSDGIKIAYLTDAGTPGISDPGSYLTNKVWQAGLRIVPVPGAAAFTALLSVAGIPGIRLLNLGFLPKKKGRQTLLGKTRQALQDGFIDSVAIYESPERLVKLLRELQAWQVDGLSVCLGRELTKLHEEVKRGRVEEILADYAGRARIKGEIAIIIFIDRQAIV